MELLHLIGHRFAIGADIRQGDLGGKREALVVQQHCAARVQDAVNDFVVVVVDDVESQVGSHSFSFSCSRGEDAACACLGYDIVGGRACPGRLPGDLQHGAV